MYAIIADGPHQYRVEEGQVLDVERKDLPEDATEYTFDRVLLIGGTDDTPKVGEPTVDGAKVTATVVTEIKGKKITIQKHKPRKNYKLKKGHRQKYTRVRIEKIEA